MKVTKKRVDAMMARLGPGARGRRHGVRCALKSGFPPCCIAFFELFWRPITLAALSDAYADFDEAWEAGDEAAQDVMLGYDVLLKDDQTAFGYTDEDGDSIGYIRCPACVVNKVPPTPPVRCGCKRHGGDTMEDNWNKKRAAKGLPPLPENPRRPVNAPPAV